MVREIEQSGAAQPQAADGPRWPPYEGPFHIPVLLDATKRLGDFNMTRLIFFSVDATGAVDDWVARLRAQEIPFLLLGLTAVMHRPDMESVTFVTPAHVNDLFNAIEETEGLVVETDHVWLPNFLFEEQRGQDVKAGAGHDPTGRGALWRISFNAFKQALRFRQEAIGQIQFLETCRELMALPTPVATFSPQETTVFRRWSASQFADARANYEQQRDDPARGVLRWVDAAGNYRAG